MADIFTIREYAKKCYENKLPKKMVEQALKELQINVKLETLEKFVDYKKLLIGINRKKLLSIFFSKIANFYADDVENMLTADLQKKFGQNLSEEMIAEEIRNLKNSEQQTEDRKEIEKNNSLSFVYYNLASSLHRNNIKNYANMCYNNFYQEQDGENKLPKEKIEEALNDLGINSKIIPNLDDPEGYINLLKEIQKKKRLSGFFAYISHLYDIERKTDLSNSYAKFAVKTYKNKNIAAKFFTISLFFLIIGILTAVTPLYVKMKYYSLRSDINIIEYTEPTKAVKKLDSFLQEFPNYYTTEIQNDIRQIVKRKYLEVQEKMEKSEEDLSLLEDFSIEYLEDISPDTYNLLTGVFLGIDQKIRKIIEHMSSKNQTQAILTLRKFAEAYPKSKHIRLIKDELSKLDKSFNKINYKALLIANQYYEHEGTWPDLTSPINDVDKLATILKVNYNVQNLEIVKDVNAVKMKNTLISFSNSVKEGESALIYYAGHGHHDGNDTYWIPVDGKDKGNYIENSFIEKRISEIASKSLHFLLIADSCYSSKMFREGTMEDIKKNPDFFSTFYWYKSSQVISSSFAEAADSYKGIKNSPFALQLFAVLEDPKNTTICASELGLKIKKSLPQTTNKQIPDFGRIEGLTGVDNKGEFFFSRSN